MSLTTYSVQIVDENRDTLYLTTFQAEDEDHATEQAKDHVHSLDGEFVGAVEAI